MRVTGDGVGRGAAADGAAGDGAIALAPTGAAPGFTPGGIAADAGEGALNFGSAAGMIGGESVRTAGCPADDGVAADGEERGEGDAGGCCGAPPRACVTGVLLDGLVMLAGLSRASGSGV